MNKIIVLLVGVFLICATSAANANEYWEDCNSCSSSQKKMQAKQLVPLTYAATHYVYMMDFTSVTLNKYRVIVVFDPELNRYVARFAIPQSIDSNVTSEFTAQVNAIKADMAVMEQGIVIPETVVPSAYDVLFNSSVEGTLSAYIDDNLDIWQSIGMAVAVPLSALGKIVDMNFIISVTFSDGSTLNVQLTGVSGSLLNVEYIFEYQIGSARDMDGNTVPDSLESAAPYVGVSSTEANAEVLSSWITDWFGGGSGSGGVSCYLVHGSGSDVALHCSRE